MKIVFLIMLKFKKMGSDKVPLLLVTANVGSIFEDPSVMLPIWTSEFLQAVSRMDPKFIALHLQEVGGKTYEKSMQYVEEFVQRLCDCPELRLYDKIRIYLDEDFSSPEKFTALGNMYFAHSSLADLKMWDFELRAYVDVLGKEVYSGNIEKATTKEKAKFPQHFFPECKWSRKGFLRTRWMIRGTAIEFVNIHLFHDASNLLAMEPFPSVYCRSRRRALRHTLRHLHADAHAAPYFIFGDFNFRTDTGGVVKKVTEESVASRVQNGSGAESSRLQYRAADGRLVLAVGKKEFAHADHQKVFREPWLQRFDRELEALWPHLYEFPVKFPPTYPFEEDVQLPTHYMKTRCPAWCDRILLSQSARLLVQQEARAGENRHLHASRKSVADSTDSSGRVSSSDSSPARSSSPKRQSGSNKTLEKKGSLLDVDALSVPGIGVSRKSIADPTSLQHALNARARDADGSPARRRLVRNQSEGCDAGGGAAGSAGGGAELRRLAEAPRRRAEYGVIGDTVCMGDHKPIFLRVLLQSDRGTPGGAPPAAAAPRPPPPRPPRPPRARLPRRRTDPDLYALAVRVQYASLDPFVPPLPHPPARPPYAPLITFVAADGAAPVAGSIERFADDRRLERTRTGSLNESILRVPQVEITAADGQFGYEGVFAAAIDETMLCARPRPCLAPYTPESVDSRTPDVDDASSYSGAAATDAAAVVDRPRQLTRDHSVSPTQLKTKLDMLLNDRDSVAPPVPPVPPLGRLDSRESCKSDASKKGGLCCLALKCYGFCRRRARSVRCKCIDCGTT